LKTSKKIIVLVCYKIAKKKDRNSGKMATVWRKIIQRVQVAQFDLHHLFLVYFCGLKETL